MVVTNDPRSRSVDVVCCALSVQYLQFPAAVFEEFARVLDEGGHLIVSFSNRMFPTKAVRAWRQVEVWRVRRAVSEQPPRSIR